ncbi:MAG: hypothetical protein WD004_00285 [Actinomycetota bacterium]
MPRTVRVAAVLAFVALAGAASPASITPRASSTELPHAPMMREPGGGIEQEGEGSWTLPDRGDPSTVTARLPAPPTPRTSVLSGFDGLGNLNSLSPSDTTGAGGDNHVLTAVNVSYRLTSRTGVPEVGPATLRSLFPTTKGIVFDPRVVYDPYDAHYVMTFLSYYGKKDKASLFVVSIPDVTASMPATWCARKLRADQVSDGKRTWADYPGLGLDDDRVFITTNQFGFDRSDGYVGAQVLAFDKTSLYDCGMTVTKTVFGPKQTRFPDGGPGFTLQPATMAGGVPGSDFFLVAYDVTFGAYAGTGNTLVLYRIRDTGGGLALAKTEIGVGPVKMHYGYGLQRGASSADPDAYWDTGDLEFAQAFYDPVVDRIYTAHAIENDLGGDGWIDVAMRWYEIDPAGVLGSSTVTRKGVFGTQDTDAGWPAVTTDSAGNVYVGYSRASGRDGSKEYLSSYVTVIEPGDTVPDPANTLLLESGNALYDPYPGPERWGDYQAVNRDPLDGTQVWVIGQIARSSGAATTPNFRQTVDLTTFP